MKKDKSGERFGKDNVRFRRRDHESFVIGPRSHPRKVDRWLRRGGGSPLVRTPEQMARVHVHPRSKRATG